MPPQVQKIFHISLRKFLVLYLHFGSAPLEFPLSQSKPNHHPGFQVDELALKFATKLECNLLYDYLRNNS